MESRLLEFLSRNNISFEEYEHPPVFTVEDVRRLVPSLAAAPTKNLFMRDTKGKRHFLVIARDETTIDLARLAIILGAGRLSFASAERLKKHLGIEPGAVSLLALINDSEHAVEVVLERALSAAEALQCHPLVNTRTVVIAKEGVERFLKATGHRVTILDLPASP